jgi:hypothetical protein
MLAINDYPNYFIDNMGNVYSKKYKKKRKLKPQKVSQSTKGYYQVRLYGEYDRRDKKGRKIGKLLYIHRLVWENFVGEIPEDKQIDHIDSDTTNNSVENLQLLTPRQNKIKGLDKFWRPYRDEFIEQYEKLGTYKKVAEHFNVNENVVHRVIKDVMHQIDWSSKEKKTRTIRFNPNLKDYYTETNFRTKKGRDSKENRKRDDKGRFM